VDERAAAADNGRTLLGDWRVQQQKRACRGWPTYTLPAGYHQPVPLDIPTLLVSGELDPVTPASGGEEAVAALHNGLHVVVPSAAHGYNGLEGEDCVTNLIVQFYREGSVRGLDTSCVRNVRRPPFVTSMPQPVALDAAAVERFAGTYASTHPAVEVRFEALDGVLRARVESWDRTVIASPVSATEFHFDGFPAEFVFRFSPDARTVTMPGIDGGTVTLARR
jgi:hypothetical protein